MFNHILVAIDGSDNSRNVVPTAIEVAKKFKSDIYVLHVSEHGQGHAASYPMISNADADALVAKAIESVKAAGVDVKGEVAYGYARRVPEVIAETAHKLGSDLIVMGSRGLTDAAGVFVGSVTHGVIHLVKAAVLVDRTAEKAETATAVAVKSGAVS